MEVIRSHGEEMNASIVGQHWDSANASKFPHAYCPRPVSFLGCFRGFFP